MKTNPMILILLALGFGVSCYWYASTFYTFNGQQWALFCGKRTETSPVLPLGACRVDTTDQNGNPACSLSKAAEMGTWSQYGMTDPNGCALTLSDPPQPWNPAKCSPADFRIWSFTGPAGMGQGQRGPVPSGGLPACPTP